MFEILQKPAYRPLGFCCAIAVCALLTDFSAAQESQVQSVKDQQKPADGKKKETPQPDMQEVLPPELIAADLEQFRKLLKTEWLVANLSDADYDAAITDLAKRSANGLSRSEFLLELQKILALGKDGHAGMTSFPGVMGSFHEERGLPTHDFIVDIWGDDYVAYRIKKLPQGLVNPRYRYRYELLRAGFPYLTAIDGVPMDKWIETISRYVPKGPELSVRWRCLRWIGWLPFWRNQMGLPQSKTFKVQLASRDKSARIELDAPVTKYANVPMYIPKPDWKIIDDEFGYLWIRSAAASGVKVILKAMPQIRNTKGLILDMRGNDGGAPTEIIRFMTAYLVRPDDPRRVALRQVSWSGRKQNKGSLSSDDNRLTEAGRKAMSAYKSRSKPKPRWNPPSHRQVEWRYFLLARPEAEPGIYPFNHPEFPTEQIYHYSPPVVVLMDHRCFSSAEIFLAAIRSLDNVTLVGSPTTEAGATSPEILTLEKSGLRFELGTRNSYVQSNGDFIDGNGVQPDIVAVPDIDYYLGRRDRMLETAIEVLKKKIAAKQ